MSYLIKLLINTNKINTEPFRNRNIRFLYTEQLSESQWNLLNESHTYFFNFHIINGPKDVNKKLRHKI